MIGRGHVIGDTLHDGPMDACVYFHTKRQGVLDGIGKCYLVTGHQRPFPLNSCSLKELQRDVFYAIGVTSGAGTIPEHLSSPPVFSGVRVTRSFVLYVCFIDRCLSFCTFSFGHCVVCSSSIYGF